MFSNFLKIGQVTFWPNTLRNFSTASLATSRSVGRAPKCVLWFIEPLVSIRNTIIVMSRSEPQHRLTPLSTLLTEDSHSGICHSLRANAEQHAMNATERHYNFDSKLHSNFDFIQTSTLTAVSKSLCFLNKFIQSFLPLFSFKKIVGEDCKKRVHW